MATSKKSNGRRATTGALRESVELFRTMADTAPVMIWLAGPDKLRNFFNKGWLDFRGRTLEEELGEGWAEGVHPEDLGRFRQLFDESFEARRPYTTEYRLRRHDGQYRWILANGVPRYSPAGDFEGFIGTCVDIDDRRRAEELRRRSEARLRSLFESNLMGVIFGDLSGRITDANESFLRMTGYTREDLRAGRVNWREMTPPEHLERTAQSVEELQRMGAAAPYEKEFLRKDGTRFPVIVSSNLLDRESGECVAYVADITAQRRAQEALRASEELSQAVLDSLPAHIAVLDRGGRIVAVNETWRRFAAENGGAAPLTDVGANYLSVCGTAAGDDAGAADILEGVTAVLEGRSESYSAEYPCHSPEEERWFMLTVTPLPGGRGAVVTHLVITERKRAEEQLERRARQAALGAAVGAALAESGAPLRRTLQRCTESVVEHLDAAFARIWTLNPDDGVLELQASAGLYTHTDGPHGRVPVGKFKIGLIAEERRPHLTNSVVGDPRVADQEWARREGMVSFAGYPLIVEDRLVGVLAMFARRPLPDDTLEALSSVANIIAQGIERKRADEALKAYAREREQMFEEVSTPVVPVLEGVLVVPLIGSLDTFRMERATKAALHEVARTGARHIILDITGARVVDTHAVANLGNLVAALRLVGAEALVTGVSAHAAQSLVGLGLDLQGLRTHRTLAQALAALIKNGGRAR